MKKNKLEKKLEHPITINFKQGIEVPVEVPACVIVPGKIITGITFPPTATENKFPHVSLMINQWKP